MTRCQRGWQLVIVGCNGSDTAPPIDGGSQTSKSTMDAFD